MSIDQAHAAFEAWCASVGLPVDKDSNGTYKYIGTHSTNLAWQAALASPEVQALRGALQEVVDAADGDGWKVLDASLGKQRAALAAMETQK